MEQPRMWCARLLILSGAVLLGWCGLVYLEPRLAQSEPLAASVLADQPLARTATTPLAEGALLGTIRIPRLNISAPVREGVSDRTLRVSVGRIPSTAWPPERGHVGLAGHRDSFFRRLQGVHRGDTLWIEVGDWRRAYLVSDTQVVDPEDTWVLQPDDAEVITLVTCFPFTFIGPAPRRFVVRAVPTDAPDRRASRFGTHVAKEQGTS